MDLRKYLTKGQIGWLLVYREVRPFDYHIDFFKEFPECECILSDSVFDGYENREGKLWLFRDLVGSL